MFDLLFYRCVAEQVTGGTSGGHYAGARADRNVLAEAAERRLQEQASRGVKGEVRLPKSRDELPDLPSNREAGLRWQVG